MCDKTLLPWMYGTASCEKHKTQKSQNDRSNDKK